MVCKIRAYNNIHSALFLVAGTSRLYAYSYSTLVLAITLLYYH